MKLVELPSQDVFELTKGHYRGTGYQIPYFDRHGKSIADHFRIRFHEPQRNLKKPKFAKKSSAIGSHPKVCRSISHRV